MLPMRHISASTLVCPRNGPPRSWIKIISSRWRHLQTGKPIVFWCSGIPTGQSIARNSDTRQEPGLGGITLPDTGPPNSCGHMSEKLRTPPGDTCRCQFSWISHVGAKPCQSGHTIDHTGIPYLHTRDARLLRGLYDTQGCMAKRFFLKRNRLSGSSELWPAPKWGTR